MPVLDAVRLGLVGVFSGWLLAALVEANHDAAASLRRAVEMAGLAAHSRRRPLSSRTRYIP